MNRILITGGAGFIGSHLCERLLNEGNEVICVDNFYTGKKENIIELQRNPYFEVIRHNITFPLNLEVDEIYNLACPASPVSYQLYPVETVKTCLHGSINVLELSKKLRIRIFQASTSEVYGDPKENPQKEEYWGNVNPIGIRSCYDEGKRCAETLFFDYHRQYGVDIRVGRIFNTYGPKMSMDDGRVVTNFICNALKNEPLKIYGNGEQTRSFCYVDDTIELICRMMNSGVTGPINLGNDSEVSILELAELIVDMTGSKSSIINIDGVKDDPIQRRPDVSKMVKVLGYRPKVTLEEGLEKTIQYLRPMVCEGNRDIKP